jgi:thiol:disulfide interchange protein DsbD
VILLVFSSVAFGMALPYLVLTARPAWMKFLPKPGGWMVSVKQLMGFLMMATLIWLLYILGKQLGMEAVIWTSSFLLVVGFACWLIGRFATLTAPRLTYAVTWVAAVAAVAIGYWLFVESILDVRALIAGKPDSAVHSEGQASSLSFQDPNSIQWQPFSLPRLEALLRDNETVFIDFTAEWCLTCKVNEKTVLTDTDVVERFRRQRIVAIKADWTNRNPEITKLLAKFGRSGVPLYVIFPAGKPGEPIVLPEVITSSIVLDAIDRATSATIPRI